MDRSQAKYIDIDGINTRYFEAGDGEPMILIHGGQPGMASSSEIWFLNIDELAKKYHVYALDKLGQGYTDNPKINEDYTMGAQVKHALPFRRRWMDFFSVSKNEHNPLFPKHLTKGFPEKRFSFSKYH